MTTEVQTPSLLAQTVDSIRATAKVLQDAQLPRHTYENSIRKLIQTNRRKLLKTIRQDGSLGHGKFIDQAFVYDPDPMAQEKFQQLQAKISHLTIKVPVLIELIEPNLAVIPNPPGEAVPKAKVRAVQYVLGICSGLYPLIISDTFVPIEKVDIDEQDSFQNKHEMRLEMPFEIFAMTGHTLAYHGPVRFKNFKSGMSNRIGSVIEALMASRFLGPDPSFESDTRHQAPAGATRRYSLLQRIDELLFLRKQPSYRFFIGQNAVAQYVDNIDDSILYAELLRLQAALLKPLDTKSVLGLDV